LIKFIQQIFPEKILIVANDGGVFFAIIITQKIKMILSVSGALITNNQRYISFVLLFYHISYFVLAKWRWWATFIMVVCCF